MFPSEKPISSLQYGVAGSEVGLDLMPPAFNGMASYHAPTNLPQTGVKAIFQVSAAVRLLHLVARVTTVLGATATNAKWVMNPTVGADVDLCAVVAVANAAVGSILTITGTLANAMIVSASGVVQYQANSIILPAGNIEFSCSANNTGQLEFFVHYLPIVDGALITAAP